MFKIHSVQNKLLSLLADKQGNFAMMTAIMLPVLFGFAGAGLEMTKVMQVKSDLQNAADAATLAGATAARLAEGKKSDAQSAADTNNFLAGQDYMQEMGAEEKKKTLEDSNSIASRNETSRGTEFVIKTNLNYTMKLNPLLGFIGVNTMKISVTSTATSSFNKGAPLSMYLVLDKSGSMSFRTDTVDKSKYSCYNYEMASWPYPTSSTKPCYVNKITSLKTAVSYLVDTLNKSDPTYKSNGSPESALVRTGAVAYNDKSSLPQGLSWGTKKSKDYVQALSADGGTDANAALTTAYTALRSTNADEIKAHKDAGNASFERFIVLMTDGEMTGDSATWNASTDASVRRTCTTAKADGIKIYTVAFMAPDKGKSLLQACATSMDNYYAPENMDEIVEAFGDIAKKAAGNISRLTN